MSRRNILHHGVLSSRRFARHTGSISRPGVNIPRLPYNYDAVFTGRHGLILLLVHLEMKICFLNFLQ